MNTCFRQQIPETRYDGSFRFLNVAKSFRHSTDDLLHVNQSNMSADTKQRKHLH